MLLGFCVEKCCAGRNRLYWRGGGVTVFLFMRRLYAFGVLRRNMLLLGAIAYIGGVVE